MKIIKLSLLAIFFLTVQAYLVITNAPIWLILTGNFVTYASWYFIGEASGLNLLLDFERQKLYFAEEEFDSIHHILQEDEFH